MSRSPHSSNADDKPLLLEYRCHPLRQGPPSSIPTSPSGTRSPDSAPPLGPFPLAEPRRIVLSTDSPAALKVGTQQLIPRSLAVSTKTKNPSRPLSTGAASSSQEPAWPDQRRASIPSINLEEEEDEEDGRGMLKRNLRNMSYRAAMKGLGTEMEPAAAAPSLKPMLEEGSAPRARSPGRNKRTFGRKRVQKRGGSFKDRECCFSSSPAALWCLFPAHAGNPWQPLGRVWGWPRAAASPALPHLQQQHRGQIGRAHV